ncbi:MAG TPA: SIMPL domain-containing protein [Candidatus Binatia bacterium]|nr:SIMPL domain-containing protein [Candidatus Binatia bacterium]
MAHRNLRLAGALGALTLAATAAAHDVAPPLRSLSVTGSGEVLAVPDRARLSLGVDVLRPEVKAAEAEVNRVVRDTLAELRKLGVKDERIASTAASIQPEYVWDDKARRQVLTGYRVHRQIEVTLDRLELLGDVLLRSTAAGIQQLTPPLMESSRQKELEREALAEAARDARARAQAIAAALGIKLGAPLRLSSGDSSMPPPVPMMKTMAMRAEAAPAQDAGVSLGQIRVSASVSAEFELQAP